MFFYINYIINLFFNFYLIMMGLEVYGKIIKILNLNIHISFFFYTEDNIKKLLKSNINKMK